MKCDNEKPKILIVDPVHSSVIDELGANFCIRYSPKLSRQELLQEVSDTAVLIVRSGHKIDSEVIETAKCLELVARAGTGMDNISTELLAKKGIKYFNVAGVNSDAVAELALAFIFALSRNIINNNNNVKKNIWLKEGNYGVQVTGKTLGIIGYGEIGKSLARKANALGLNVLASVGTVSDDVVRAANIENVSIVSSAEIYARSDYVSLSLPLNTQTVNYITTKELKQMKSCAFLINVSRGKIVNDDDLYHALKSGIIKGAATDVFAEERTLSKMFELDNIICTPHIGAMTIETQAEIAKQLIQKILLVMGE
jgi:D-3-phosphoglycerate dehydrogenase